MKDIDPHWSAQLSSNWQMLKYGIVKRMDRLLTKQVANLIKMNIAILNHKKFEDIIPELETKGRIDFLQFHHNLFRQLALI